jgi:hypothetical protein
LPQQRAYSVATPCPMSESRAATSQLRDGCAGTELNRQYPAARAGNLDFGREREFRSAVIDHDA